MPFQLPYLFRNLLGTSFLSLLPTLEAPLKRLLLLIEEVGVSWRKSTSKVDPSELVKFDISDRPSLLLLVSSPLCNVTLTYPIWPNSAERLWVELGCPDAAQFGCTLHVFFNFDELEATSLGIADIDFGSSDLLLEVRPTISEDSPGSLSSIWLSLRAVTLVLPPILVG